MFFNVRQKSASFTKSFIYMLSWIFFVGIVGCSEESSHSTADQNPVNKPGMTKMVDFDWQSGSRLNPFLGYDSETGKTLPLQIALQFNKNVDSSSLSFSAISYSTNCEAVPYGLQKVEIAGEQRVVINVDVDGFADECIEKNHFLELSIDLSQVKYKSGEAGVGISKVRYLFDAVGPRVSHAQVGALKIGHNQVQVIDEIPRTVSFYFDDDNINWDAINRDHFAIFETLSDQYCDVYPKVGKVAVNKKDGYVTVSLVGGRCPEDSTLSIEVKQSEIPSLTKNGESPFRRNFFIHFGFGSSPVRINKVGLSEYFHYEERHRPAKRYYKAGDKLSIYIGFTGGIFTRTDTPEIRLALNIGDGRETEPCTDVDTPHGTLKCIYTIAAGDDSIGVDYTSLNLPPYVYASIPNKEVDTTLPAPGSANSLKGETEITIDTTAPRGAFRNPPRRVGLGGFNLQIQMSEDIKSAVEESALREMFEITSTQCSDLPQVQRAWTRGRTVFVSLSENSCKKNNRILVTLKAGSVIDIAENPNSKEISTEIQIVP